MNASRATSPKTISAALTLIIAHATALAADDRTIFAQGTTRVAQNISPMWLAVAGSHRPAEETRILFREKLGDNNWLEIQRIPARATGITTHRGELVAMLAISRGQPPAWAWISSRFSYGPNLPDKAALVALAGDRTTLWALGRSGRRQTNSATRPATTAPAAAPLALYKLAGETWQPQQAAWPADVDASAETVSMAVIAERPTVALAVADELIHILQLEGGRWTRLERLKVTPPPRYLKLIEVAGRPALWCQPDGPDEGIGGVFASGRYFRLDIPPPAPRPTDVDVTSAGDQIRVFWRRADRLLEQRFDHNGRPEGQPVEPRLIYPREDGSTQWTMIGLGALAGILVLNALLRRRQNPPDRRPDRRDDRSDQDE